VAAAEARCHAVTVEIGPSLTQVVAHRGANEDEPEHSLAAYLQALQDGADAIECDVRLTGDGTLVCVHDRRIDRTSSGRGAVSVLSLDQLHHHDFSAAHRSWWDFEDPSPDETRTRLLTLRTLLATMLDASPRVAFAIETKHPVRYAGYVERALIEVLDYFGLSRPKSMADSRVRVMSFSRIALRRVHRLAPRLPTVLLMERIWPWQAGGSLPPRVPIAGISIASLLRNPDYPERVRARGGDVHVWTVDSPEEVQACLRAGVGAIISNRPAMVRGLLHATWDGVLPRG